MQAPAPAPAPGPSAPALPTPSLAGTLPTPSQKRRRTQSSPSSPNLPSREPSLPYLRSGLTYLNSDTLHPDTIGGQLDGADDGDLLSPGASQPAHPFQNHDPATGMAETGAGAPELHELRPPELPSCDCTSWPCASCGLMAPVSTQRPLRKKKT